MKEQYFYLDSTPTHSYMKALYKYPQAHVSVRPACARRTARRTRHDPEFEILDTGVFDQDRYFDVFVEYAKNTPDDILIRITVCNRGPDAATIHVLPTLWSRNTWIWGCLHEGCEMKPRMAAASGPAAGGCGSCHAGEIQVGRRANRAAAGNAVHGERDQQRAIVQRRRISRRS